MAKKKKTEITIHSKETRIIIGILILIAGITVTAAPFLTGAIFDSVRSIFGTSSIVWGFAIIIIALRTLTQSKYFNSNRTLIGAMIAALTSSVFFMFWVPTEQLVSNGDFSNSGGQLGYIIHSSIVGYTGQFIEFIILLALTIVSFSLLSGIPLNDITEAIEKLFGKIFSSSKKTIEKTNKLKDISIFDGTQTEQTQIPNSNEMDVANATPSYIGIDGAANLEISDNTATDDDEADSYTDESNQSPVTPAQTDFPDADDKKVEEMLADTEPDDDDSDYMKPQFPDWELPSTSLLTKPVKNKPDTEIHKHNSAVIEKTLRSFNIESQISKITIGPTVVQYALSITVGTKVSKVRNLTNDLALALATPESQIRIEAPIPGTSLIGIEIPNPTPNFVYIKEMIEFLKSGDESFELPLILGKNVGGKCIIKDLTKMPHLLVAGATGTGKSVGINSILTGFLMTKSPDEVKLILVDPKMVELAPYNGIPHLLTPVITDMELVDNALQWSVEEMLRRYRVLKQIGSRNIVEYNNKTGANMPYIVIVIDEMADLMLSAGLDVENKIVRLAQMARAVGIHLILATQRPSVDVITGLIKANVPGRVAFSVSTAVDSRVIVDQSGAETLIGKGDMMFKSPQISRPIRLQGAWTDTPDTEPIVEFIKDQAEDVEYHDAVTKPPPTPIQAGTGDGLSEDELFEDALKIVISDGKASASMLQRRLRIGYNRAARLLEDLENCGAVGSQDGSSARDVLVSSPDQILGNQTEND